MRQYSVSPFLLALNYFMLLDAYSQQNFSWQCRSQSISVLYLQLVAVEDGAVGVHEDHGGGEVKEAGGEHKQPMRHIVGLTDGEGGGAEVEAVLGEHNHAVEAQGQQPAQQNVHQAHLNIKMLFKDSGWFCRDLAKLNRQQSFDLMFF